MDLGTKQKIRRIELDITTSHGVIRDACLKPYDRYNYTLGYIENDGNYLLAGFEVPYRGHLKYSFWFKKAKSNIKENLNVNFDNSVKVIRLFDEYYGMLNT